MKFWIEKKVLNPIMHRLLGGNIPLYTRRCSCDGKMNFHQGVYPIMFVAQLFGVLPVVNISSSCPSGLKFDKKSIRFFFSLLVAISSGFEALLSIAWISLMRVEFVKVTIVVYYVTNFAFFVCFLRLVKDWPRLMAQWHEVEKKLEPITSGKSKLQLSLKVRRIAFAILVVSSIEHIVYVIGNVSAVTDCPKIKSLFQAYLVQGFPEMFYFFDYSFFLGVYVKIVHVLTHFAWCFGDFFVIMFSCGLSSNFKKINEHMLVGFGKVCFEP